MIPIQDSYRKFVLKIWWRNGRVVVLEFRSPQTRNLDPDGLGCHAGTWLRHEPRVISDCRIFFWNVSRRPDDLVEITSLNLIKARRIVYVVSNLHYVHFYETHITILLGGHNSQIYYQYQSQVKQSFLPTSFENWLRTYTVECSKIFREMGTRAF